MRKVDGGDVGTAVPCPAERGLDETGYASVAHDGDFALMARAPRPFDRMRGPMTGVVNVADNPAGAHAAGNPAASRTVAHLPPLRPFRLATVREQHSKIRPAQHLSSGWAYSGAGPRCRGHASCRPCLLSTWRRRAFCLWQARTSGQPIRLLDEPCDRGSPLGSLGRRSRSALQDWNRRAMAAPAVRTPKALTADGRVQRLTREVVRVRHSGGKSAISESHHDSTRHTVRRYGDSLQKSN